MDKVSYALGLSIAGNLKGSGVEGLNTERFSKGINDGLSQTGIEISEEEANQLLNTYFTELQEKAAKANQEASAGFFTENGNREEVVTLESGLQYEILTTGNGDVPSATDQVKCHYHGTLLDGTVFDSSVSRGEPAVFGVNQVIKGWVEALQLMPIGSKWKLYVPSELAYGAQGAGQAIGPHTNLIFEVELIDIVK